MIQIQKLYKSYDDVIALNGIDLKIRDGAITGLLGPNGAGKTTLVSILNGIIKKNMLATYTHLHAAGVPQWAEVFVNLAIRMRDEQEDSMIVKKGLI